MKLLKCQTTAPVMEFLERIRNVVKYILVSEELWYPAHSFSPSASDNERQNNQK